MVKPMRIFARYTFLFIAILMTLSLLNGCQSGESKPKKRKPIDLSQRTAPDFTSETLNGDTFTLSDYKGKKAVIVDIWATWCKPCQMEMPLLEQVYQKYSDKLEIVAISIDSPGDIEKIRNFVSGKKITFNVIHDTSGEISNKFPTRTIPFLTIIDKQGNIVKTYNGFSANLQTELENLLNLK